MAELCSPLNRQSDPLTCQGLGSSPALFVSCSGAAGWRPNMPESWSPSSRGFPLETRACSSWKTVSAQGVLATEHRRPLRCPDESAGPRATLRNDGPAGGPRRPQLLPVSPLATMHQSPQKNMNRRERRPPRGSGKCGERACSPRRRVPATSSTPRRGSGCLRGRSARGLCPGDGFVASARSLGLRDQAQGMRHTYEPPPVTPRGSHRSWPHER